MCVLQIHLVYNLLYHPPLPHYSSSLPPHHTACWSTRHAPTHAQRPHTPRHTQNITPQSTPPHMATRIMCRVCRQGARCCHGRMVNVQPHGGSGIRCCRCSGGPCGTHGAAACCAARHGPPAGGGAPRNGATATCAGPHHGATAAATWRGVLGVEMRGGWEGGVNDKG